MAIRAGAALAFVLFAGLTTVGARQVFDEQAAHSRLLHAQQKAGNALRDARAIGLTPSELAPFQTRFALLAASKAPASSPFIGSQTINFDDLQTHSYNRFVKAVRKEVHAVAARERALTEKDFTAGQQVVNSSNLLDLPASGYGTKLQQLHGQLKLAATPLEIETIRAALSRALSPLRAAIDQRQAYIANLLKTTRGDEGQIRARANADVDSAQTQSSLLAALKKPVPASQQISTLQAAVNAAKTPQLAALKSAELHDLIEQINLEAGREIPAKLILISTEKQLAYVYQNGEQIYETPVTTGGPELPTDHGVFHIYEKISPFVFHSPWPVGSPYYYPPSPVTYWMPFDDQQGLHDASWRSNFGPGSNLQPTDLGTGNYILGTHGCVNLPFAAAQFIWDFAPLGTTVVVV